MKNGRFEDMYDTITKIIELADRAPTAMRDEVFKILLDAAKDNSTSNLYTEEILKLSETVDKPIKDYIDQKQPASNIERSLLFVYYLEDLGIKAITAKHIEACYELSGLNEPGNLTQNLRDACSSRYAYLESVQNHFRTTKKGREFFDSDPSK